MHLSTHFVATLKKFIRYFFSLAKIILDDSDIEIHELNVLCIFNQLSIYVKVFVKKSNISVEVGVDVPLCKFK